MPIEVAERFDSRHVTTGRNSSAELLYFVRGTDDDAQARIALTQSAPTLFDLYGDGSFFLPRESVTTAPLGPMLWDGRVNYSPVPQTNDVVITFDTTGGTQKRTNSIATIGRYAPTGGTAPNYHGAIGVTDGSIEGVEVVAPSYKFSETHYFPDYLVTNAYRGILFRTTGKVNDGQFKGFARGEALFLGSRGARRGAGDWEVSFDFACYENETNVPVAGGTIIIPSKEGWQYVWVRYEESVDMAAHAPNVKPIGAYVEQVYRYRDFSLLGIDT